MKKLVLAVGLVAAICSCNKKETVVDNTDFATDSVTVPETNEPALIYKRWNIHPHRFQTFWQKKTMILYM